MSKSNRKRKSSNFVRGVRAESALRAYTTAQGYLLTRDRDQANRLLEERIEYCRQELRAVNDKLQAAAAARVK